MRGVFIKPVSGVEREIEVPGDKSISHVFKLLIPGKIYLILSVALAAGIGAWWHKREGR